MDDVKAGIKSTALRFGKDTPRWLALFGAAATGSFYAAGTAAGLAGGPLPYYEGGLAMAAGQLAWQVASTNLDDRADCAAKVRLAGP